MTVQIGEIIRAVISYHCPNASVGQNTFTWELTIASADEQDILDDLEDWAHIDWGNEWDNLAATVSGIDLIEVDIINLDGTVNRNIGSAVIIHPGVNPVQPTSAAVSGYFQAETARTKTLGKKYPPFLNEDGIDSGLLNAGALAAITALFGVYIDPIALTVAGVLLPGVVSRVTQLFYEFTGSGYTTDIPAYQRRRKVNVGS